MALQLAAPADASLLLTGSNLLTNAELFAFGGVIERSLTQGAAPHVGALVSALLADARLSPPSCAWEILVSSNPDRRVPEAESLPSVTFSVGGMFCTAFRSGGHLPAVKPPVAAPAPAPAPAAGKAVAKQVPQPAPAPSPLQAPTAGARPLQPFRVLSPLYSLLLSQPS